MLIKERLIGMGDVNTQGDFMPHRLVSRLVDFGQEDMAHIGEAPRILESKQKALVVYQWDIEILSWNVYGKMITEKTFTEIKRRMIMFRYFGIYDDKNLLARACGRWIFIDPKERKMVEVPSDILKEQEENGRLPEKEREKIKDISSATLWIETMKNPVINQWKIQAIDVDVNGHVNNRVFPRFAYNGLGFDFHKENRLSRLKITYHKEEQESRTIIEEREIKNNTSYHRFSDVEGTLLASLQYQWEKRR